MTFAILSLGTAVPSATMNQVEGERIARSLCCATDEQASWLPNMYRGTGIDCRHTVLGQQVLRDVIHGTRESQSVFLPTGRKGDAGPTTGQRMAIYAAEAEPLALRAAARALEGSGVAADAITHLVTVSCTGFQAPGVDRALITQLGLPATTQRTHVGYMGCHGAMNGLRVAAAFTGADSTSRVLLCAVELCSLHYHYGWDPQKVIANALFADGAAALVGVAAPQAAANAWRLRASGSYLVPDSADAMSWTVGDHGFEMTLSKRVPGLIAANLRGWLEAWLKRHDVALAAVRSWAIHPGGPRILTAVAESLGLDETALQTSRDVFAKHGNMSSPTVLFILDALLRRHAPRPCVAMAFGPGLTAEAALFA